MTIVKKKKRPINNKTTCPVKRIQNFLKHSDPKRVSVIWRKGKRPVIVVDGRQHLTVRSASAHLG